MRHVYFGILACPRQQFPRLIELASVPQIPRSVYIFTHLQQRTLDPIEQFLLFKVVSDELAQMFNSFFRCRKNLFDSASRLANLELAPHADRARRKV